MMKAVHYRRPDLFCEQRAGDVREGDAWNSLAYSYEAFQHGGGYRQRGSLSGLPRFGLPSPGSDYITGEVVYVDGGMSA